MWMEVHIYIVLKLRVKSVTYESNNGNTKSPELQEIQLGILGTSAREFMHFAGNSAGPEESAAGVTYLSMRIHPKSCCIFPLKVATTLLSGSRKGLIGT